MTSIHYPKLRTHGSVVRSPINRSIALYDETGNTIKVTFVIGWTNEQVEQRAKTLATNLNAQSWAFI